MDGFVGVFLGALLGAVFSARLQSVEHDRLLYRQINWDALRTLGRELREVLREGARITPTVSVEWIKAGAFELVQDYLKSDDLDASERSALSKAADATATGIDAARAALPDLEAAMDAQMQAWKTIDEHLDVAWRAIDDLTRPTWKSLFRHFLTGYH